MAGIYDVNFTIVSDFVNYSKEDIEKIIYKLIKDYRSKGGLSLNIECLTINKKA